jgi:hypothetical protein
MPATNVGVTDYVWCDGELVAAALDGMLPGRTPEPQLVYAPFTVVRGGRE